MPSDELRLAAERIITYIEDAETASAKMPVQLVNHHGAAHGYSTVIGIPLPYWDAIIEAVNDYVRIADQEKINA